MEAEDVRRVFETILPDAVLLEVIEAAKLQERERKLDALRFLRAMVIAASTVYGGRQADVARLYFESGAPGGGKPRPSQALCWGKSDPAKKMNVCLCMQTWVGLTRQCSRR